MHRILVVDDEPSVRTSLQKWLGNLGYESLAARTAEEAVELALRERPDVVLLDVELGGPSGLDVLRRLQAAHFEAPVLMMTAYGTTEIAIEATRLGAFEYVLKPFDLVALRDLIERSLRGGDDVILPVRPRRMPASTSQLLGSSARMHEVYKLIGKAASSELTVLIRGESGTGKELVARAIHAHGRRADRPFVAVNCSAIPESLGESELFGHERGAFTGADARRAGYFEQAHGGTIFLDEIGDMSRASQARLLRVLQERTLARLGSASITHVDVRVLAATNQDLERFVATDRFRADLFHRLNGLQICVPPLRERRDDVVELAQAFAERESRRLGLGSIGFDADALQLLLSDPWPGNVRELEHRIQRAVLLSRGRTIRADHVRPAFSASGIGTDDPSAGPLRSGFLAECLEHHPGSAWRIVIEEVERELLQHALQRTGGNLSRACLLLGISRPTMRDKLRRLGLGGEDALATEAVSGEGGAHREHPPRSADPER